MSAVYLHVGQCGIQIGQELWTKAILRTQEDVDLKQVLWSGESPRCLFIDGERKVIQKFSHEMKKIKYEVFAGHALRFAEVVVLGFLSFLSGGLLCIEA